MYRVEFMGGCPIDRAAQMLVDAALKYGAATGQFNGVALVCADRNTTAESIVAGYNSESNKRAEAYRKSPEGLAAAKAAEERRSALQQRHDALMRMLPSLDFNDELVVLDWLCQMQEPSDSVGIIVRRETILSAFERHGFKPGVNCGADFRKDNRDNEFRWLVGQALETLKACAIHGLIHKFAAEWKAKFAAETVA